MNKFGLNSPNLGLPTDASLGLGQVYMGRKSAADIMRQTSGAGPSAGKISEEDDWRNLNEARIMPQQWTDKERDEFVRSGVMRKVPGFNENMGLPEILAQWDDMVKLSQQMGQQGIKMSPWDIMNTYKNREGTTYKKGNWEYDAVTDQPVKYIGPLERTSTSTRVALSTREDALSLAKQSMAQILGRAPRPEEVASYLNLLNGYEKQNPETSTTTSTIDPTTGEVASSNTSSTGGVTGAGRQALLEQQMLKTNEAGSYQAATTYYSALMQELARGY